MKKHTAFHGLILALALPALAGAQQVKTAEQTYKNIQVLKGIPASDVQDTMWVIRGSLGVRCDHCHGQPFDKDEKKPKETARKMIRMVQAINREHFDGKPVVTCNTCHHGQTHPAAVPSVLVTIQPRRQPDRSLPPPEQVLSKYVEALGGRAALDKSTTRIVKGSRVNADGSLIPTEVYQKAPNKVYVAVTSPKFSAYIGFNGADGWTRDGQGREERVVKPLTRREAELFPALPFERFAEPKVTGKEMIGDREAYVVEAKAPEGTPEKFYFDVQSGLLVRRMMETATSLGPLSAQIDYEDYRDAGGVKVPYLIRWTTAGFIWSRKVSEVQNNAPIDDGKFEAPAVATSAGN